MRLACQRHYEIKVGPLCAPVYPVVTALSLSGQSESSWVGLADSLDAVYLPLWLLFK